MESVKGPSHFYVPWLCYTPVSAVSFIFYLRILSVPVPSFFEPYLFEKVIVFYVFIHGLFSLFEAPQVHLLKKLFQGPVFARGRHL